jgi:hypothetical protein
MLSCSNSLNGPADWNCGVIFQMKREMQEVAAMAFFFKVDMVPLTVWNKPIERERERERETGP